MATDVYYNGVWLHNVSTREFHQEATYDASGTDQMSQHFRMRFEGLIHLQAPTDADYGLGGGVPFDLDRGMWVAPESMIGNSQNSVGSASNVYHQVRAKLAQPRRPLGVWVNGVALFQCVPTGPDTTANPDRDVKNGPHPISFDLTQVISGNVFRVSFAIECEKLECALCDTSQYGSADIPYILSNRWSLSESMDSDYFVHRTIQGRMQLSASSWWNTFSEQPQGLAGHLLKMAVIPGLEDGFRRESIDYATDASGLVCSYAIMDRQVTVSTPFPLTRLEGEHTETIQNGVTYISEARVTVAAPANVHKQVLISRAIQFIDAKLAITTREYGKDWMLQNAVITERIGAENSVEAAVRIMQTVKDTDHVATLLATAWREPPNYPVMAGEPEYDPRVSWSPDAYGYTPGGFNGVLGGTRSPAVLALLHCYLQEPCAVGHGPNAYQQAYEYTDNHGQRQQTEVKQSDAAMTPVTVDQSTKYSDDHKQAMYTHAFVKTRYTSPRMRVQLPIASTVLGESEDTCKVCQLSKPICRREIHYQADRIGSWPQIPQPMDTYKDGEITATLLHWDYAPLPPELTLDKNKSVFRIEANYVYALNRPPKPEETLKIGWLPFYGDPVPNPETGESLDTIKIQGITQRPALNPGSENQPSTEQPAT